MESFMGLALKPKGRLPLSQLQPAGQRRSIASSYDRVLACGNRKCKSYPTKAFMPMRPKPLAEHGLPSLEP